MLLLGSLKTHFFSFVQNAHYFNGFNPLLGKYITLTFELLYC